MALGLTQPLTEMSTRNISWGVKAAGAYGWQPYHLHVPNVLKSWSINLPESLRPVQACNGIALLKNHWNFDFPQIRTYLATGLERLPLVSRLKSVNGWRSIILRSLFVQGWPSAADCTVMVRQFSSQFALKFDVLKGMLCVGTLHFVPNCSTRFISHNFASWFFQYYCSK